MTIDNEKFLNDFINDLSSIVNENPVYDDVLYRRIAECIRNLDDSDIDGVFQIIREHDGEMFSDIDSFINALSYAFMAFEAIRCPGLALAMLSIMRALGNLSPAIEKYAQASLRSGLSKSRKGKNNRHYPEALEIAKNTWEAYPNASLGSLSERIYAHLHAKWNDSPSANTVKKWLRESGLNPPEKQKNKAFQIVINRG